MKSTFVIVGAGQAGSQAVDTLRREGFDGRIVLVGDEEILPYQRPPLSKRYLAGDMSADRLYFKHLAYYEEHQIELKLGAPAVDLVSQDHRLMLSSGEQLFYDRLLLCTGAAARRLGCAGAELAGIHYLRAVNDVPPIRSAFAVGSRVVIIGGGYIGLETAATARKAGCSVTVLEMSDRLMSRVVAANVSQYFEQEHRRQGVSIVCNSQIVRLEGTERVKRVVCQDGRSYEADIVLAGVGAVPNAALAERAGLYCDNGVVVDEFCRSSDPDIFSAGDCTNHPSVRFNMRVRLESVDNAIEQAKVAALNMLGGSSVHNHVPWFWSDQFENKLLIVGLSAGHEQQVTRGNVSSKAFSVCYLKGGELIAVEAINQIRDYMSARKLIPEHFRPRLERLSDPTIALKDV